MDAIGRSVFDHTPALLPNSLQVLRRVRESSFQLILATKGEHTIQEEKIRRLNIHTYFDRVYIFPEKEEHQFREIAMECFLDLGVSWSIGNSIKSDINPALRIGMMAIWIRNATWDYEVEEPADKSRLYIAKSITDVPTILSERGRPEKT